jgi:glycosyltransferase involved in cell wall biosynthesis
MNVFVLPSLSEGISNTILEAMACGLPVIATQVGGNPELITVGETGSLVPAADYQQLAQEMAKYLLDPEMAGRCGKHARADVERRFGLNRMMEQYVGVYRRVLKLN